MHQKNIELLAARLIQLGCKPMISTQLAAHTCFGLPQFDLTHVEDFGAISCHVLVHCCRGDQGNYDAIYYTALLKKRPAVPEGLEVLDRQMAAVDWGKIIATRMDGMGSTLEDMVLAASLLEQLFEADMNGLLRYRYWSGTPLESMVPNITLLKSQYELQQRFYLTPDQPPIRFEEAYRFLQSRWMEKRFHTERKLLLKKERTDKTSAGNGSSNKLLNKRKIFHRS